MPGIWGVDGWDALAAAAAAAADCWAAKAAALEVCLKWDEIKKKKREKGHKIYVEKITKAMYLYIRAKPYGCYFVRLFICFWQIHHLMQI